MSTPWDHRYLENDMKALGNQSVAALDELRLHMLRHGIDLEQGVMWNRRWIDRHPRQINWFASVHAASERRTRREAIHEECTC